MAPPADTFSPHFVIPTSNNLFGQYYTQFRADYTSSEIKVYGATAEDSYNNTPIGTLPNDMTTYTDSTFLYANGNKYSDSNATILIPGLLEFLVRSPRFFDGDATPLTPGDGMGDGSDVPYNYLALNYGLGATTPSTVFDLPMLPAGSILHIKITYSGLAVQNGDYFYYPITMRNIYVANSTITCFRADSEVLVLDEDTGIEKNVFAKDIKKGDLVYSAIRGYVPIIANICSMGHHQDGWYVVPQGSLGPSMPNSDLHIKDTHPLLVNGQEIKVKDLPQAKPSGVTDNVSYTFATEIREPVKINGADVYTWNYNDWLLFVESNPRVWSAK